jgi:hypothetical protein
MLGSETKKTELNPEELSKLFKGCCVATVQRTGIFKPKVRGDGGSAII